MYANNCHSVICPFGFQTLIMWNLCLVSFLSTKLLIRGLLTVLKRLHRKDLRIKIWKGQKSLKLQLLQAVYVNLKNKSLFQRLRKQFRGLVWAEDGHQHQWDKRLGDSNPAFSFFPVITTICNYIVCLYLLDCRPSSLEHWKGNQAQGCGFSHVGEDLVCLVYCYISSGFWHKLGLGSVFVE